MNYFTLVPIDVQNIIFSCLPPEDLSTCASTDKAFSGRANEAWKGFAKELNITLSDPNHAGKTLKERLIKPGEVLTEIARQKFPKAPPFSNHPVEQFRIGLMCIETENEGPYLEKILELEPVDPEVVNAILDKGVTVTQRDCIDAIATKNADVAKAVIAKAKFSEKELFELIDKAIETKNAEIIKLLLPKKETPSWASLFTNHLSTSQFLDLIESDDLELIQLVFCPENPIVLHLSRQDLFNRFLSNVIKLKPEITTHLFNWHKTHDGILQLHRLNQSSTFFTQVIQTGNLAKIESFFQWVAVRFKRVPSTFTTRDISSFFLEGIKTEQPAILNSICSFLTNRTIAGRFHLADDIVDQTCISFAIEKQNLDILQIILPFYYQQARVPALPEPADAPAEPIPSIQAKAIFVSASLDQHQCFDHLPIDRRWLDLGVDFKFTETVMQKILRDVPPQTSHLNTAIIQRNWRTVELLLDRGAAPDHECFIRMLDAFPNTDQEKEILRRIIEQVPQIASDHLLELLSLPYADPTGIARLQTFFLLQTDTPIYLSHLIASLRHFNFARFIDLLFNYIYQCIFCI